MHSITCLIFYLQALDLDLKILVVNKRSVKNSLLLVLGRIVQFFYKSNGKLPEQLVSCFRQVYIVLVCKENVDLPTVSLQCYQVQSMIDVLNLSSLKVFLLFLVSKQINFLYINMYVRTTAIIQIYGFHCTTCMKAIHRNENKK